MTEEQRKKEVSRLIVEATQELIKFGNEDQLENKSGIIVSTFRYVPITTLLREYIDKASKICE